VGLVPLHSPLNSGRLLPAMTLLPGTLSDANIGYITNLPASASGGKQPGVAGGNPPRLSCPAHTKTIEPTIRERL
jgi:hypothetical protein